MIFYKYKFMHFMENEWNNNHDTILEETSRLNEIFEERDINIGDINSSPNFWN